MNKGILFCNKTLQYCFGLLLSGVLIVFLMVFFPNHSNAEPLIYAENYQMHSKNTQSNRQYSVRLPKNYEKNSSSNYPVIYFMAGQWSMLPGVAVMDTIEDDLPEFIIVGVHSKGDDHAPIKDEKGNQNSEAKAFSDFFYNELIPKIESEYRVADYKILSGYSGSARFVLHSLLDKSSRFNAYFAFSPSLESYIFNRRFKTQLEDKKWLSNSSKRSVYITMSSEGSHMQEPFEALSSLLNEERAGAKYTLRRYPDETHSSYMLLGLIFALRDLFDGWVPSWSVRKKGLSGLQYFYKELSEKYGFDVKISSHVVYQTIFALYRSETALHHLKASELVDFQLANNSNYREKIDSLNYQLKEYGFLKASKRLENHLKSIDRM
ncbi:MAG: hypothetical protein COA86_12015 [Kangiella sp.]|nr:MAG: hypothetical protein COA86_12015 [Kangiella sp.]